MKIFIYLTLVLGLLSCITIDGKETKNPNKELKGKVVGVTDGDTFTLLTESKEQKKIRLHGIDAPERKQEFGQVSKQKLSDLIFGKEVIVQQMNIDRYKRIIGIVHIRNLCVNEEMLKSGLACHFKKYDKNPEWAVMEDDAKMSKKGLWVQDEPVNPWDYRKIIKIKTIQ